MRLPNLNPFAALKGFRPYQDSFGTWVATFVDILAGGSEYELGLLDYLLVLPGLTKLARSAFSINLFEYRFFIFLAGLYFFSILLTFMLPSLLFIGITYLCFKFQGKRLENRVLEMEVLLVDQSQLKDLDYTDTTRHLNKDKLIAMFYSGSREKTKKLKDYPDHQCIFDNSSGYQLKFINLGEDKEAHFFNDHPENIWVISQGPYEKSRPIAFIIPSRENKKEILALARLDAFGFRDQWRWSSVETVSDYSSKGWQQNKFEKAIAPLVEREDPLRHKILFKRSTIEFSLLQAAKTANADSIPQKPNLEAANEPSEPLSAEGCMLTLMPEIHKFLGYRTIPEDTAFSSNLRNSNFNKNPKEPWVTQTSTEPWIDPPAEERKTQAP